MPDAGAVDDLGLWLPAAEGINVNARDHWVCVADEDKQAPGQPQATGGFKGRDAAMAIPPSQPAYIAAQARRSSCAAASISDVPANDIQGD